MESMRRRLPSHLVLLALVLAPACSRTSAPSPSPSASAPEPVATAPAALPADAGDDGEAKRAALLKKLQDLDQKMTEALRAGPDGGDTLYTDTKPTDAGPHRAPQLDPATIDKLLSTPLSRLPGDAGAR